MRVLQSLLLGFRAGHGRSSCLPDARVSLFHEALGVRM